MLVLTRGKTEAVQIGEDVRVVVLGVQGGQVRLGYARTEPAKESKPNQLGYDKLIAKVQIAGSDLIAVFTVQKMNDGSQFYNAVTLEDRQKKTPVGSPRDTLASEEHAQMAFTGVNSFLRRPLTRVNPESVFKVTDPETGEPLENEVESESERRPDAARNP